MGPGRSLGVQGGNEGQTESEHSLQAPEPIYALPIGPLGYHWAPTQTGEGENHTYRDLSGMRSCNVLGRGRGLKSPVGRGSESETGREGDGLGWAGLGTPRSGVLRLPRGHPQPSSRHAPSPYQIPVAAQEGAGHLPGAGPPGWGCQALHGCKVGRYGPWLWG